MIEPKHLLMITKLIDQVCDKLTTQDRIDRWWEVYVDTMAETHTNEKGEKWTPEEVAQIKADQLTKMLFQRGYEAGTNMAVADILGRSVAIHEIPVPEVKDPAKVIN